MRGGLGAGGSKVCVLYLNRRMHQALKHVGEAWS